MILLEAMTNPKEALKEWTNCVGHMQAHAPEKDAGFHFNMCGLRKLPLLDSMIGAVIVKFWRQQSIA